MIKALPYWPAALRLDQSAAYVGLSVDTFKEVCPIKPIQFTPSARGARYLRASLDAWLASLDPNSAAAPKSRIAEWISGKDTPPRKRRRRARGVHQSEPSTARWPAP